MHSDQQASFDAPRLEEMGSEKMRKRVCVITSGHVSSTPRMEKAAEAFADAGYGVRVVRVDQPTWARPADANLRITKSWDWSTVTCDREEHPVGYWKTAIRHKAAKYMASFTSPLGCPLQIAILAQSRMYPELLHAALSQPADLFYGGTAGGLAVAAAAGARTNTPYALDLEDFHSEEQDPSPAADLSHCLTERVESMVLRGATFLTAGSSAIAEAYSTKYGFRPVTINNTFPLPTVSPEFRTTRGKDLRLIWLSQTVGPSRGLEDAVLAIGRAQVTGELHLRGAPHPGYLNELRQLADAYAPGLRIFHHAPDPEQSPIDLCRGYDVGLALEQGHVRNRALCLTNKVFTYILAGLAVAFTDTPGQRPLAEDLGPAAFLYSLGDIDGLAAGLKRWAEDKALLNRAKMAAWESATRRWHWEHHDERGALLELTAGAL